MRTSNSAEPASQPQPTISPAQNPWAGPAAYGNADKRRGSPGYDPSSVGADGTTGNSVIKPRPGSDAWMDANGIPRESEDGASESAVQPESSATEEPASTMTDEEIEEDLLTEEELEAPEVSEPVRDSPHCPRLKPRLENLGAEYAATLERANNYRVAANKALMAALKASGAGAASGASGDYAGVGSAKGGQQAGQGQAQVLAQKCIDEANEAAEIRSEIEQNNDRYQKACESEGINLHSYDQEYFHPDWLVSRCNDTKQGNAYNIGDTQSAQETADEVGGEEGQPSAENPTNTNADGSDNTGGGDPAGTGDPNGGAGPQGGDNPANPGGGPPGGPAAPGGGDSAAENSGDGGGFNPLALAPLALLPALMGGDDDEEPQQQPVEEEELECKGDKVLNDAGDECVDVLASPECEAEGMIRNDAGVCVVADGECGGSNYPDAEGKCVPKPMCELGEYFNVDVRACIEKSCPEGQTLNQNGGCEEAQEVCDDECAAAKLEEEEKRVLRSPVEGRGQRTSFEGGVPSFRK